MAFNGVGEAQIISYIVQLKDLSILEEGGFDGGDFSKDRKPIVDFILDHYHTHGNIPDEKTVIGRFPEDYDRIPVTESWSYLYDNMVENAYAVNFERVWNELTDKLSRGSMDMGDLMANLHSSIEHIRLKGKKSNGVDITKDLSRVDRYEDKLAGGGNKHYLTGIETIDEAFGGILPDDLLMIVGRLSHGKTWVLNLLSAIFYMQGYSILFYSGEMEADQIAYRFDSIVSGVSSGSLLWGRDLKYRDDHVEYQEHLDKLKDDENFFTVVTPNDFGGIRPTVKHIEKLVEEMKPDFVFIDQASLMEDWRKEREFRVRFGNVVGDLKLMAGNYGVPVILAAQANREATAKDDDGDYTLPEEFHVAESDLMSQHATRLISICKSNQPPVGGMSLMKMGIKKNRHGNYPEWEMMVQYDTGLFIEKDAHAEVDVPEDLFDSYSNQLEGF